MEPIFSLCYTSCRPANIRPAVNLWLSQAADATKIEVVISVDGNNPDAVAAAKAVPGAKVVVQDVPPFNSVRGWNKAAEASTGKVLICMADDFNPPHFWDTSLLALKPDGWIDGEYVVKTEDGYVHDIFVLSILTRARYNRYGYVFYPQYESMFCDTEFGTVAVRDGVVLNGSHLLFEHMHPDCGKRPRDDHDCLHGGKARWDRGEMLFNYRKGCDFPVDDGPEAKIVDKSAAPAERKYAVYIQATKDDFFLVEICKRLVEEGAHDFFFCIPDEYWSGAITPQEHINEVVAVARAVEGMGAKANVKIFDVSNYRFPGDSRIAVETRVRNDTLAWIRRSGFHHILVVDGDELWAKGMLSKVDECVEQAKPGCISCPMVPVVGVPGYPVHMASDRAIVYVGGSTVFRECRSPAIEHFMLNNCIVVHFTASRKTLQEVIDKHRASGHYDDPEYDFEGWIKNVLPNLKPGYRGAHMYKRYQIWPLVRNWTRTEMEHIPQAMRPYMGAPVDEPSPIAMALDRGNRKEAAGIAKPNPTRCKTQVEEFLSEPINPYRR
jgi:hypothetical protein